MAHSLPLRAYVALRQRTQSGAMPVAPMARPSGWLVWIHLPQWSDLGCFETLIRRIDADQSLLAGPPPTFLITGPSENLPSPPGRLILMPVPNEHPTAIASFLHHWRPDLLIWNQGQLRPALLDACDQRSIPRILVNAVDPSLTKSPGRWFPGVLRSLLEGFGQIITVNDDALLKFRRLGLPPLRVEALGPLSDVPPPLPYNEAERADMAEQIETRPVWLAIDVPEAEAVMIAHAHLVASRRAPRLLLILVPDTPEDGAKIAVTLRQKGFEVAIRSADEELDDRAQIYVADFADEAGLWMRMSPITYFGGTLERRPRRDPIEAAELGSAIVHGPRLGQFAESFLQLSRAGATLGIKDAQDLGEAIERLLPPNQTAKMAMAGWTVTSEGAEVTNRVIELIVSTLDGLED